MTESRLVESSFPFRRVMLAAVKEGLYHPRLPSLRRMDMDDVGYKLPEAHSRTTTACGPRDFGGQEATCPPVVACPPSAYTSMMEGGKLVERHMQVMTSASGRQRMDAELPVERPDSKHFRFNNNTVRYMQPDMTSSWRYTLMHDSTVDGYGRRPTPTDTSRRGDQFTRNVCEQAWR